LCQERSRVTVFLNQTYFSVSPPCPLCLRGEVFSALPFDRTV